MAVARPADRQIARPRRRCYRTGSSQIRHRPRRVRRRASAAKDVFMKKPLIALLCLSAAFATPPVLAQAPATTAKNVETEPIRCWWRTTAGAIRTGEHFSLVLTCAVLENEAVQVVPDEARLGSAVIQLAPFEIVGGSHPTDLRTDDR